MAVVRTASSESAARGPADDARVPIRTCIGCRKRATATELLRVVVAPGTGVEVGQPDQAGFSTVVPDPRGRAPGRGAWLHPDSQCVEAAQRRRAFARALRVPGAIDATPVHEFVAEHTRQEISEHEQAMKPQS